MLKVIYKFYKSLLVLINAEFYELYVKKGILLDEITLIKYMIKQ